MALFSAADLAATQPSGVVDGTGLVPESSGLSSSQRLQAGRLIALEMSRQLTQQVKDPETGQGVTGKELLVTMLLRLAFAGRVKLQDGRELVLNAHDWAVSVRWLTEHLDGPSRVNISTAASAGVNIQVVYGPGMEAPHIEGNAEPIVISGPAIEENDQDIYVRD